MEFFLCFLASVLGSFVGCVLGFRLFVRKLKKVHEEMEKEE